MAKMAVGTGRVFGEIPGYPVGSIFVDRADLARSGVHPPRMKGISGRQNEGADSIVVSGGYEDDHDLGDLIIYTGEGGRDPNTGKQVADQEFRGGNRALAVSCDEGLPVRVIRGLEATRHTRRRPAFATTGCSTSTATGTRSASQGFGSTATSWSPRLRLRQPWVLAQRIA
jgi:hypothetical protein